MQVQALFHKRRSQGHPCICQEKRRCICKAPTLQSPRQGIPFTSISSPILRHKTSKSDQYLSHHATKLLSITKHHLLQHCHSRHLQTSFPTTMDILLHTTPSFLHPRQARVPTTRTLYGLHLVGPSSLVVGDWPMPSTIPQCQPLSGFFYTLNKHFIPSLMLVLTHGQIGRAHV